MGRRHQTCGPKAGPTPNSDDETVIVPDLLLRTLRCLLTESLPVQVTQGDLRLALRHACDRARDDGLRAEQLLLVLKAAWRELPERQQLPQVEADAALARVVTACIDEYYQSPPAARGLSQRGACLAAGHGQADFRNADIQG